jgi:TolB-like protein/DNA-binding winged helix-turn-helix (wHTH) protein/tetratricopeptide (TPR) repeat protein
MSNKTNKRRAGRPVYEFGDFCLDLDRCILSRDGEPVPLRPKAWAVLVHLVKHQGRLVSRTELIDAVWHNASVCDDSLTQCIVEIRRAIDDPDRERLRTVPRRGFVFEMPVSEVAEDARPPLKALYGRHVSWSIAAIATLAAGVAVFWLLPDRDVSVPPDTAVRKPSIAVLPFSDMTDGQDKQYFADGVAEEILNHLALVPELRVISRSSSFAFRNERHDVPAIAGKLAVDFVLEGSVRGSDGDMRITTQLIEAASDSHVWAASYDRKVAAVNAIAVQNDVAVNVASAIGVQTGVALSSPPARTLAVSPEAQDHYLRGMYYFRRIMSEPSSRETYDNAVEQLQAATRIEPTWAPAYAALGGALHFYATSGHVDSTESAERFEQSRKHLEESIRLDPAHGPAYSSLAFVTHAFDRDYVQAEALYAKAAQLGSLSPWGYAILMRTVGRLDESIEHYEDALLRDPLSIPVTWQLADALRCERRYAESARHIDKLLEESPEAWGLWQFRAYLSAQQGDFDDAREIIDRYRDTEAAPIFGATYALLGRRDDAVASLENIEQHNPHRNPNLYALVALTLGLEERALDYLEATALESPRALGFILCDDDIGPLVDNPRFQAILADAGVPLRVASVGDD